ncbi:MAG: hypothetical protein H9Q67_03250 [Spiroplasma ixodetis]|nr:hypothetical protein [Spiroplasma ixodetis]
MKKLIASGFVLATLLGTTPQISNLTVVNTKIHNENNLKKLNLRTGMVTLFRTIFW